MAKTLYQQYYQEIKEWDWDAIKRECEEHFNDPDMVMDNGDSLEASSFLGTVFDTFPSGKYYTPWACSNVTLREAHRDEEFQRALDDVAEEHGLYITSGEGDPCDIFASMSRDKNDTDDSNQEE